MKNLLVKSILIVLCLGMFSCHKDDDNLSQELILENQETQGSIEKNGDDLIIICSSQGIPDNFVIESYLNVNGCPNENLFLGRYNAVLGRRISPRTPNIYRAGSGCNDNYCIWIVGENFEPNAYIDIRTTTGQSIIGTYRGADRQINISPNGDDTMSIRLRTPFEFDHSYLLLS